MNSASQFPAELSQLLTGVALLMFVINIYGIYRVFTSHHETEVKILWAILIWVFSFIAVILFLLFFNKKSEPTDKVLDSSFIKRY